MRLVRNAVTIACAVTLFACKEDKPAQTSTSAANSDRSTASGSSTATQYGGATDPSSGMGPSTGPSTGSTTGSTTGSSTGSTTTTGGSMGGPSDTTGGGVQASPIRYEMAGVRITGARCDHVMTCKQIGPAKRFATHEICKQDQSKKTADDLKSTNCPNGFDSDKLSSCLAAIAQQDCSNLIVSLQNVDACKPSILCSSGSSGSGSMP